MNLRGPLPAELAACCAAICIAAGASACATPAAQSLRVVVTLKDAMVPQPSAIAALEAQASRNTGLPVRYLAAVSPTEHVVEVVCGDAAGCDRVPTSLRGDGRQFAAVRVDARKRASQP